MKKQLLRWAKLLILLYCIIGIAWYYGQERLIFHPSPVDRKTAWYFAQPVKELNIPYDATTNINVLQFMATDRPADSLPKGVVLYFHDSKGNNSVYGGVAPAFTAKGYQLWLLDYPGFGKSTGQRSEKKLYEQALLFYKLARSRWQPGQIIIYGNGLGTGIAAQLASIRDCRRLILESPYYSLTSAMQSCLFVYPVKQMLHFHLATNEYLPAVTAPITIFHGASCSSGCRLKPLLKNGDEFITLPGSGHDDIHRSPRYQQKLDSLLSF